MVAVMDLPAAQRLLGRESTVDRVAVDVRDDEDPTIVARRLKAVLGNGATVDAPESRGEEVDKLLFSLRSMLLIAGSLAVIVGVFIVFNTVSTSVHQRRRELALLSTVGVRRTALIWLCLIETLALAFLGIAGGLLGARVLAASASGVIGSAASEIWLNLELGTPGRASSTSIAGAGIGLATALLASGLAIRSTFITPTVEALRPPSVEAPSSRSPRTMFALGLTLVMATWAVVFAPSGLGLTATVALVVATQVSAYAGVALIGPPVVAAIGAITRVSARFSASAPIRLAAENLPRTPSRSGATVATIVAAVGMATTLTGLVQSFESAWLNWVEEHFGADLFVGSGSRFHLRAGPPMDIDLAQSIMHIDGVESVEPFRVLNSEVNGQPVFLQGIALDERLAHGGLPMVEGTLGAAAPALRAGTGVLVSDNLATRLGLSMGDVIVIPSPQGPRRLRIEGSYVDYLGSLDLGAIVVAQEQLQDIWRDRYANLFRVWLKPTARADDTRAAILTALGGSGYYVISARQFLDGVQAVLNSFFVATWALVAVAVLVAVIGIVNSELATVIDRRVEITMLRTIGLRSTQLIRAVVLECATLGALGGAIGVLLGLMLSDQFVEVALRLITGWRIPFSLHFGVPIITILAATAVATIAGWIPARAAVRLGVHGGRD
jgi:putative ABC transport system permease protein